MRRRRRGGDGQRQDGPKIGTSRRQRAMGVASALDARIRSAGRTQPTRTNGGACGAGPVEVPR